MAIALSEDPFETKQSLTGTGQPAGLRNISMRPDTPMPGQKPPIYVTSEGIASTDPNVGSYNRQAMRMASSAGAAEAPAAPGVAAAADAAAPAAGRISRFASGLRTFGTGMLKAAAPAILARTAVSEGVTPTSTNDARLQAIGGPSNASLAQRLSDPVGNAMMTSTPIVGPLLGAFANTDPQLGADIVTRAAGVGMNLLGLNGIADRQIAKKQIPAPTTVFGEGDYGSPGPTLKEAQDQLAQRTLRGSSVAPGFVNGDQPNPTLASPTAVGPGDLTSEKTQLDNEIGKIGKNPFNGIRGNNFYAGTDSQLASNIADELGQRAKVRALQAKYGTDVTAANNAASIRAQMLQMQLGQANRNQDELKAMFDRTATVPVLDKNGQPTGSTVDPALRNRAEDFARSAVAGWDTLSPEQRAQGFENVRHKFLLQELANSGDLGTLGKFFNALGVQNQLGGYTAQPLKIKAVRPLGASDMQQGQTSLADLTLRRPYVEFENGKLYPLRQILNTPELKSSFEQRLSQSSKQAQDQYKKYLTGK